MKLSDLYKDMTARLSQAGIETAELDARWILEHRAGVRWADMIADGAREITSEALQQIEADMTQRIAGVPLSRLYGVREFWGMEFALSNDTLDPRPDTETLIEAVLARCGDAHPARILDLGTGTGCILFTLLKEFPQATGVGVDLSEGALKTARKNAIAHALDTRAVFAQGSWAENINESFDLVVSNPPYIRADVIPTLSKEVQNHDPILALEGGIDGLEAYKNIFSTLSQLLKPQGAAFFEIGYDQKGDMERLSKEYRIRIERCHLDLAGNPRVVEMTLGNTGGDK